MQRNFRAITLIAVTLISGCGQVSGTAQPATELFDPCTDVPDEAIRAAGADPAVVSDELIGALANRDTDICMWSAGTYFLSVISSIRSREGIVDDPRYERRRDVEITDRTSAMELLRPDPLGTAPCDIAFPWQRGMIIVNVESKTSSAHEDSDNCLRAIDAASILSPALPM